MSTPYEHLRGGPPKMPKNWLITGVADMAKAQRLLGFEPTDRLTEGLAEAMPWFVGRKK